MRGGESGDQKQWQSRKGETTENMTKQEKSFKENWTKFGKTT